MHFPWLYWHYCFSTLPPSHHIAPTALLFGMSPVFPSSPVRAASAGLFAGIKHPPSRQSLGSGLEGEASCC
jgi:hypothetical protein